VGQQLRRASSFSSSLPQGEAPLSQACLEEFVRTHVSQASTKLGECLTIAVEEAQRSLAQGFLQEQHKLAQSFTEQLLELRLRVDALVADRGGSCGSRGAAAAAPPPGPAAPPLGSPASKEEAAEAEAVEDEAGRVRLSSDGDGCGTADDDDEKVALRRELGELRGQTKQVLEQVGRVMELNSQLTGRLAQEQLERGQMRARIDEAVGETGSLATAAAEVASVVAWLASSNVGTSTSAPPLPPARPHAAGPDADGGEWGASDHDQGGQGGHRHHQQVRAGGDNDHKSGQCVPQSSGLPWPL